MKTNSGNSETPSALLPQTCLWLLTFLIHKHIFSVYRYILIKPQKVGENVAPLYIVTPTYTRPTQLADLTRLANTLRLVREAVH